MTKLANLRAGAIVHLFVFALSFGCQESDKPIPAPAPLTTNEAVVVEECLASCQLLLSCDEFNRCSAYDIETAADSCARACQGPDALAIISESEFVCDLRAPFAQDRFSNLSLCSDLNDTQRCLGKDCEAGFICDPSSGACVDSCAGMICPGGLECVDGVCPDPCTDVECAEGLGCFMGDCIDLCYGVSCAEGQQCDTGSGQCLDQCGEVQCGLGERCDAGMCVPVCQDVTCPEDYSCHQMTGNCVNRCDQVTCREGYECNPELGICRNACADVTCVEGWTCEQGSCVFDDPCAEVSCDSNELCNPETRQCESFYCISDRFEINGGNNDLNQATELGAQTLRLDDLTVCGFDLDWYVFDIPAYTSARVSLRFSHQVGDLILRLYNDRELLRPQLEINTEDDHEYVGISATSEHRRFYLRVSSGNRLTDQNRYSLVVELNLPGKVCQQDSDCPQTISCIDALCDGSGAENPDPTVFGTGETGVNLDQDRTSNPNPNANNQSQDQEICEMDAYEPNPNFEHAVNVQDLEAGPWSAQICAGDQDTYSFTLSEPMNIISTLAFVPRLGALRLILLNESGRILATGASDDQGLSLFATDLGPGNYYLVVQGESYEVENQYQIDLMMSRPPQSGRCQVDIDCGAGYFCNAGYCAVPSGYCDDSATPNASYESAHRITAPAHFNDLTLCEADFFSIALIPGQVLNVHLMFSQVDNEDIDLKLYRPNGSLAAASRGITTEEQITFTADQSGVYTLEVLPYTNEMNNQSFVTDYTLDITTH